MLTAGCVLSFLAGLGGLRQLLIWHAPALLAVALLSLSGGERPQVRRSGGFAAGAFLWAAAGYLVNSRILSERYHFLSYESIHFTDFDPERVWQTVIDWMKLYGYRSGGKVFSVDLFFNGAFAVTVLLIVGSAIAVLRRKESYGPGERLIVWYYVSALLILLLLYGFSDMEYADRYSIPLTVFGFVVVLLGCTDGADGAKGRAALLVLAVLIGIQGVGFYRTYSGERGSIRDEIVAGESYGSWGRKATSRSLLCRQLVTEGYTQGVATFWNSNVLTELSGGALEMWTIQNLNGGEARIFRWLQQTDHDTRRPEGKVFLIAGGQCGYGRADGGTCGGGGESLPQRGIHGLLLFVLAGAGKSPRRGRVNDLRRHGRKAAKIRPFSVDKTDFCGRMAKLTGYDEDELRHGSYRERGKVKALRPRTQRPLHQPRARSAATRPRYRAHEMRLSAVIRVVPRGYVSPPLFSGGGDFCFVQII